MVDGKMVLAFLVAAAPGWAATPPMDEVVPRRPVLEGGDVAAKVPDCSRITWTLIQIGDVACKIIEVLPIGALEEDPERPEGLVPGPEGGEFGQGERSPVDAVPARVSQDDSVSERDLPVGQDGPEVGLFGGGVVTDS